MQGREYDPLVFQTPVDKDEVLRITKTWDSDACWDLHKLLTYHLYDVYSGVSDEDAGRLYGPVLRVFREHMRSDDQKLQILPVIPTNYDRCIEGAVAYWNASNQDQVSLVDGFLPERPQGAYGARPGGEEFVWGPACNFVATWSTWSAQRAK
jgi:hypothetical protein